jgi:fumarate hydratase subunit alpha
LRAILEDIEIARKYGIPICQDTGLIHYYVSAGIDFPGLEYVEKALIDATREATYRIPLRPNTVNPFTYENPGDNTGRYTPIIHWELIDGDFLDIIVVPKGGGSEAVTVLKMPPPGRGLEALVEIVVDAVLEAGAKPCPPVIIGVGVGGGADTALYLAKKAATIRRIGYRNPDPLLASLEEKLVEELNRLGIGVMGLGGNHTVLDVHIDYAYRHPANYPVAVAFQCWAARRAFIRIDHSGRVEIKQ